MPALRETGPYIYPTWLPKLLAGLDRCEWKIWFQVHHDGRAWEKLGSDFNLTRYNIEHTELVRLCTEEYEQWGFTVTVEAQNQFKLYVGDATISGRPVKGGGKTYHWAEKKCTTEIMADGSDLGVGLATGTVGRRSWEDYAPALAWSEPNLMRSLAESTW